MIARNRLTIFLDDGGVMNDNTRRAAEWRRLIGEFLTPKLGGDPGAWAEANSVVFARQWRRFEEWLSARGADEWGDFFGATEERERWLREMCEHVGVSAPRGDACPELALETERYVIPRVRAAFPGAVQAIERLHKRGYWLSTASGALSSDLEGYVTRMGVRQFFAERLYGPDLVQTLKGGPHFYRRIFEDADVDPAAALVVDDSPQAVRWAAEAGARAVLVAAEPAAVKDSTAVIGSLSELPAFLDKL